MSALSARVKLLRMRWLANNAPVKAKIDCVPLKCWNALRKNVWRQSKNRANVPHIILGGAEWFANLGTPKNGGTRLFCLSGHLNTAFVERVNLTLRRSVAALARRTWATRRQAPPLLAHLEWWRGYYHFCRLHASLRLVLATPQSAGGHCRPPRYQQRTPAMAAGLTTRRWKVVDLLLLPLSPGLCRGR